MLCNQGAPILDQTAAKPKESKSRSGKRRSVQQSFVSDYAKPVSFKLSTRSRSRISASKNGTVPYCCACYVPRLDG